MPWTKPPEDTIASVGGDIGLVVGATVGEPIAARAGVGGDIGSAALGVEDRLAVGIGAALAVGPSGAAKTGAPVGTEPDRGTVVAFHAE